MKYGEYTSRFDILQKEAEALQNQQAERGEKAKELTLFMEELKKRKQPVTVFDQYLWVTVIDNVLVRNDGILVFRFRNGKEIEA